MDWENNRTYIDGCGREQNLYERYCNICDRLWGYYSDRSKTSVEINIEEQISGSLCLPCIAFKQLSERVLELEKQINTQK